MAAKSSGPATRRTRNRRYSSHGVGPLDRRDVEAENGARHGLEPQLLAELVQGCGRPVLPSLASEALLLEEVLCVLQGPLDDGAWAAAGGHPRAHAAACPVLEHLLDRGPILEVEGKEDLLGEVELPQVVTCCERRENLPVARAPHVGDRVSLPAHELPLPDLEDHPARVVAVPRDRQRVEAPAPRVEGHLLAGEGVEPASDVAERGGALELHRLGRLLHPPLRLADQPVGAPFQHEQHLLDHRPVLRLSLIADAGGLAPPDVVVEAGPVGCLPRQIVVTGAHGVELLDGPQSTAHRAHVGVRSEVPGAIPLEPTRDEHSRERLLDGHLHVRVGLVVAQPDVEAGDVLLDQVVLEQQGLRF